MNGRNFAGSSLLLAAALCLAACGGGSGGGNVASTPTPPGPSSYPTMATLVNGSYSFPTVGVTYTATSNSLGGGSTYNLNAGGSISYNAGSDTFTITGPTSGPSAGASQSFTGQNLVDSGSPATVKLVKPVGTTQDELTITVPLTYAMLTIWNRIDFAGGTSTGRISFGGSQTQAADVPRTGSATYSVATGGAARVGATTYNLVNSTATFSANFASNSVQTSLSLGGVTTPGGAVTNFGTFNGTGTIMSTGPSFSGTFAGNATGVFSGAFFGPQAAEVGYGYVLNGTNFGAAGAVFGAKQ